MGDEGKRYIVVAALESETPGLAKLAPVVHTGVGKVNAAIHCYEAILQYKPDLVINYGTAGALDRRSGLVQVDIFIQRDMDVRPLGIPRGVTPFDPIQSLPEQCGIVIGTGDAFVTDPVQQLEGLEIELNLIDMEAYALHRVCSHLNVPFECYKYVTDGSGSGAMDEWKKNVAKGADLFAALLLAKHGRSAIGLHHTPDKRPI